jgi:hypothetical protein
MFHKVCEEVGVLESLHYKNRADAIWLGNARVACLWRKSI